MAKDTKPHTTPAHQADSCTFEQMLKEAGVPAVQIAQALGVTPQTLTPYLNGKKGAKAGLRSKIAEVVGYTRLELWVPTDTAGLVQACAQQWADHHKKSQQKKAKKAVAK